MGSKSPVISDISTKSSSRILFTNFVGREAARLNGPGAWAVTVGPALFHLGDAAAAASSSRPLTAAGLVVNMGRGGRSALEGSEPSGLCPIETGKGQDPSVGKPCHV